ncbi:MFS general substrate transporter [Atractiella rhizophila]|nr:MFS general substrate transporter [Atractiella rhizophila]
MTAFIRESTVGQLIHAASKGRLLPYPEEESDFVVPQKFRLQPKKEATASSNQTLVPEPASAGDNNAEKPLEHCVTPSDQDLEKGGRNVQAEEEKEMVDDDFLVGWYGDDDKENPQNWSFGKKCVVTGGILLLTWSVYIGSAIYASSVPGVMDYFKVSQTKSILGLSLFLLGLGTGPLILSPLSEVPFIGRNPIYMATLFIFFILQIPTVTTTNYSALMALRFFAGFIGSPALATGGATLGDIWSPMKLNYCFAIWTSAAALGPVLGPVISGFPAMFHGWRWPLYELLMISGFTLIVLSVSLPETSAATILLKRAERLRKLTKNEALRSQSEIDQANTSPKDVLYEALIRPFQLTLEPAVLFVNIYLALAYSLFYLFFESFPLVFGGIYGFNLALQGLPFLGIAVGCFLAMGGYSLFVYYHVEPKFKRTGVLIPEDKLQAALVASWFMPISLLLFGWLSRPSVHWMGPVVAAALYIPGIVLLFQSCLIYLPTAYPRYAASLLAGNDFFRSSGAAGFILFGRALFTNLGIGGGCSLLAGLTAIMIPFLWVFYLRGAEIRRWSKYAQS